jgi:tetratricopeptide (TPR) repeat protein
MTVRSEGGARRGTLRLAILVVSLLTTGFVHESMETSLEVGEAELRLPTPRVAELLSLGFDPLLANYYWVQGLHLVGGSSGKVDGSAVGGLIDLVTTLDPWVDHPYRFAAVWMTADVDEVRHANRILRRAIAYHPTDWRNRFYLGYNHFYYLQDNAEAARVLEPAIPMAGAPTYLGAFVTRLRAEGGDLESAAFFLQNLIRDTPDEFARAEYLKAHDEIETERRARYLDEARTAYWERHGEDIQAPADLWSGPRAVIQRVPPPHPHFPGFEWAIDAETQEIISTFYGQRYRLYVHASDMGFRRKWRRNLGMKDAAPPRGDDFTAKDDSG